MPSVIHDVLYRPIVDGETVLWIHASGFVEPLRYNGRKFIGIGFYNNNIVRRLISPRELSSYIKIPREQLYDALSMRTLETSSSFIWHSFSHEDQRALANAFLPLCEQYINQTNSLYPVLISPNQTPVITSTMTIQTEQGKEDIQVRVLKKTNPEVELDFDV